MTLFGNEYLTITSGSLLHINILIEMLERLSVLTTFAFILSHTKTFRRLASRQFQKLDWWLLTVLFGLIGIIGTYAGIPVNDALANSRVVGVMAAGLIGGPKMGLAAGLIAGSHRYLLGGFTAFSCAMANLCEGLLGGLINRFYPSRSISWWVALVGGVLGECLQMGIILLTAKPYENAVSLVTTIAIPMVIINSFGLAIFMMIINSVKDSREKVGSEKSHQVLAIATKTLPYLRRGLNNTSAAATTKIIYDIGDYDAVAITDTTKVLAFTGAGCAHHQPNMTSLTQATLHVLASAKSAIAKTPEDIGCSHPNCPLASAIIVPLKKTDKVIGALKLYYTKKVKISQADTVFAEGVATLFSTQLELAEIDRQAKLASRAEIKALYAQINPHFLFNALNTITSLVRTEPDLARQLLIQLGALFRITMHNTGKNITINEELTHVRAYLAIEKARHGDKLVIIENIIDSTLDYMIPSFTLQPLIENAIKHGLQPKEEGGYINLTIAELANGIEISITDNGVGMNLTAHHPLQKPAGKGIGLINVNERLRGKFGEGLNIISQPNQGTTIKIILPKEFPDEGEESA
ncbi:MAG: signal transduction histidine kinase, LytS [Firmicutes bacterium]|nr:signal transduction histidine kinase, LytS [Bacillota bacterium]